ncbi:MAG: class I SAM-dependent methyltransferase [Clostridiales bacterium]|jgi:tRNA (adenine22-N1)-methyltransferase|nr:class I SAM-dependent methyltransferase [Clostridiales bacterium]
MSGDKKISERIISILSLIPSDTLTLADIACDHALISIHAVLRQKTKRSIASDLSPMSLEKAKRNINAFNMTKKVEIRAGNGLLSLDFSEADTVVIAGIGGRLCIEILNTDLKKTKSFRNIILQPQSEIGLVRKFLHEAEMKITDETMAYEDGMFYTVLVAQSGESEAYTDAEYALGKYLLRKKHPVLAKFLRFELKRICEIKKNANTKLPALDEKERMYKEALKCITQQ